MDRPSIATALTALAVSAAFANGPSRNLPPIEALFDPTPRNGFRTLGDSHKPQFGQKWLRRRRRRVRSGMNTRGL